MSNYLPVDSDCNFVQISLNALLTLSSDVTSISIINILSEKSSFNFLAPSDSFEIQVAKTVKPCQNHSKTFIRIIIS